MEFRLDTGTGEVKIPVRPDREALEAYVTIRVDPKTRAVYIEASVDNAYDIVVGSLGYRRFRDVTVYPGRDLFDARNHGI